MPLYMRLHYTVNTVLLHMTHKVVQLKISQTLMSKEYIVPVIVFIALLALGIGYIMWLDSGCALSGIMTWGGKVCFN